MADIIEKTDIKPRARRRYSTGDGNLDRRLGELTQELGAALEEPDFQLTYELMVTAARIAREPLSRLDRKLINASLKEMRYAFGVFSRYRDRKKVSIFGSARIRRRDADYACALQLGRRMAEAGWMVVTGAGPGIMSAGNEGAGQSQSFGVNIVLPFENKPNRFIADDPKLINFKYFFTRKLMFIKEADAFVLFPGGFGTLDELFELLTLSQTGKSQLHPIVMLEHEGGEYWSALDLQLRQSLMGRHFIDPEDVAFYHISPSVDDAVQHILGFYRRYHSQRYVRDLLVVRLTESLTDARIAELNSEFADILFAPIEPTGATADEIRDQDVPELPRLKVPFDRTHFGRLRRLIDRINQD